MALTKPPELYYDGSKPPLALLTSAELCSNLGQPITLKPIQQQDNSSNSQQSRLVFYNNEELVSDELIIRYFGRLHDTKINNNSSIHNSNNISYYYIYGNNPLQSTQIDFFLSLSSYLIEKDTLLDYCEHINNHLIYRTYLVGESITIADLIVWQQLTYNVRWASFSRQYNNDNKYIDLFRWYSHISRNDVFGSSYKLYNTIQQSKRDKYEASSKTGSFNVDLKGDKNAQIVTRFPPEPSGYLHIGHAKAALLNEFYAHQQRNVNGVLILRFDDTNPNKEKQDYIDSILNDLKTLRVKYDKLTWTSDYFDEIIEYAKKLIKQGLAYVDDTPVEQMRFERMNGVNGKNRDNSIKYNLELFNEMLNGTSKGLQCALRAKIDMSLPNKCMRDPTIFRCKVDIPHHRTGNKYKAYPTYDFCCPIVDAIEGVTHAMRTTEYIDRNEQYQWFLKVLNLRTVHILEYSRLTFSFTLMSKRKLQWFVDAGRVEGWNDPRFPTVQGILRRGMTVDVLHEFMHSQGFSRNVAVMEWDKIWTMNKKIIDPIAHRYTAINYNKSYVRVHINDTTNKGHNDIPSSLEYVSVQLHPKHPDIGTKLVGRSNTIIIEQDDAILIQDNEEVTLMNWGNAIVNKIVKDNDIITDIYATLNITGDVKKTDKKLTWIAIDSSNNNDNDTVTSSNLVRLELVEFDHLITAFKLEEDTKVEDVINPHSKTVITAYGEPALNNVTVGQIIQLNRKGFYYVDKVNNSSNNNVITLHNVPDGRLKEGTLEYKYHKANEAHNKKGKNKDKK